MKSFKNIALVLFVILLSLIGVFIHYMFGYSGDINGISGHAFGSDDAFISYRYSKNLFSGHGLVFNPDYYVEGYSNLLYVIFIYFGFFFVDEESIYIFSIVLNTLFLILCTVSLFFLLLKKTSYIWALFGIALFSLNPVIWANITSGLESILVALIFIFTWITLEQNRTIINIMLLILISTFSILVRVDGFLLPIIVLIYLALNHERRPALILLSYILFVMTLYTSIRYFYYGDLIANTYYAKVSGNILQRLESGFEFLLDNTTHNGIALLGFTSLFLNAYRLIERPLPFSFPTLYVMFFLAYLLFIGGDIYYERFLISIHLIFITFTIIGMKSLEGRFLKILISVFVLISPALLFVYDKRFEYQTKTYDMWVSLGKELSIFPSDALLAIDAAGKVPYFSNLITLDMLGLNNEYIAKLDNKLSYFKAGHNKFDPNYTIRNNPDVIATWIYPNLNMEFGLMRNLYSKHYFISALVNSTRKDHGDNIINVRDKETYEIQNLINDGYNYAVLQKKDSIYSDILVGMIE